MEKLKSYISALIEAVFGKKRAFISNQVMPSNIFSVIEKEAGSSGVDFTAPCDGWVYMSGRKGVDTVTPSSIEVMYQNLSFGNRSISTDTSLHRIFIPVNKGRSIHIGFWSVTEDIVLRFVTSIGGGLTAFCRWLKRGFGEVAYV